MTGIIKDHELEKIDIKRIKHAEFLAFDLDRGDGISQLRAIRSGEKSPTGYREEYPIDCDATIELHEGYTDKSYEYPKVSAYDHLSLGYNLRLETFVNALREGDVIRLDWYSQKPGFDHTGYIGNAVCTLPDYSGMALWYETLSVTIIRKGDPVAEYHISHHMTPDNSAKMVKWYGR